jgi:hypothetical protein
MCLAKRFYQVLVTVLIDINELEAGASLLQSDRAIAQRFSVSESTARNWRRCKHRVVAAGTAASIIRQCASLAPQYVPELEFIDRISRGTQEVRAAAELLVDQFESQVLADGSTWHIYSGPLKMAFDLQSDQAQQLELLNRSSMIVGRILDLGIDQADVPCVSELIRYSTHGWYLKGLLTIREASLNSEIAGLRDGYLDTIEAALYVGDGCATPSLISGHPERAMAYSQQALALLETVDSNEERRSFITIHDARIMIRSIQTMIACYWNYEQHQDLVSQFAKEYQHVRAHTEWVEGARQEVLGIIEVARRADFVKAAYHFELAGRYFDDWLAQFGIPFSTTSPQSLVGYALLMTEGPTESAKSQISEGLIRTIDLGNFAHQIRARLCQSIFYDCQGAGSMANFHRAKAQELVRKYSLQRWCDMLGTILLPPDR